MTNTLWLLYSGPSSENDADKFKIKGVRNGYNITSGFGFKSMEPGYDYVTNVTYKSGASGSKGIPKGKYVQIAADKLDTALAAAKLKPKWIVVENEENYDYYVTPEEYLAWFIAVANVAKKYGIPVVNGGTTQPVILAITYTYLYVSGQTETALAFKKRNKITKQQVANKDWVLKEMNLIRGAGYDFPWNFHYQFKNLDSVTDFTTCIEALRFYGWKEVMSNELAMQVLDSKLVIVATQAALQLVIAGWFNKTAEMGTAKPFTDSMIGSFVSVNKF